MFAVRTAWGFSLSLKALFPALLDAACVAAIVCVLDPVPCVVGELSDTLKNRLVK